MIGQAQFTITDLYDGESLYTWVKYADDVNGAGLSDSPTGKLYMGVAVNQISQNESTLPGDYAWSLIKGEKGDVGTPGKGILSSTVTYQLHTSGTAAPTGTWTSTIPAPIMGRYMWTRTIFNYTDTTSITTYSVAYIPTNGKGISGTTVEYQLGVSGSTAPTGTWTTTVPTIVKGQFLWTKTTITYTDATSSIAYSTSYYATDGQKGDPGTPGVGVSSATVTYQNGTSGTASPTGTWLSTIPAPIKGQYLWTKTVTAYSDTTSSTTYSVSYTANDGQAGKGISSTAIAYQLSPSGITAPTGTWVASPPTPVQGQYLWTRTVLTYSDTTSSTTYSTAYNARDGIKGDTGTAGVSVTSIVEEYYHSTSATTQTGGAWSTTVPVWADGKYVWSRAKTSFSNATTSTTNPVNVTGGKGTNGITTYTWIKYADDVNGAGLSDSPDGKRFMGVATNQTSATESTSAGLYSWSPLYDNVIVGGRNLLMTSKQDDFISTSNGITVEKVGLDYKIYGTNTNTTAAYGIGSWLSDAMLSLALVPGNTYTLSTSKPLPVGMYLGWNGKNAAGTSVGFSYLYGDGTKENVTYTVPLTNQATTNGFFGFLTTAGTIDITIRIQLERSNVASDWMPSPEDIQSDLDKKAATKDLDALAGAVSSVSSLANSKAGMSEFLAMKLAYDTRMAQDDIDKDKVINDLATMAGRTALVETLAGDAKIVTEFIETVITQSDEGIFIANGVMGTGILISDDRISFMDNNVEVAYISNQTMEISHGIFVESATIGDFKFEKIPGTTILAITWVGA